MSRKIFLVEEKDDSDMEEEKYSGCLHFKIIKELTPALEEKITKLSLEERLHERIEEKAGLMMLDNVDKRAIEREFLSEGHDKTIKITIQKLKDEVEKRC